MTPVPTRVRKVSEQLLHTRFVLGDFGVTVGVRPFEEGVRDYTGGAVPCGSERYGRMSRSGETSVGDGAVMNGERMGMGRQVDDDVTSSG